MSRPTFCFSRAEIELAKALTAHFKLGEDIRIDKDDECGESMKVGPYEIWPGSEQYSVRSIVNSQVFDPYYCGMKFTVDPGYGEPPYDDFMCLNKDEDDYDRSLAQVFKRILMHRYECEIDDTIRGIGEAIQLQNEEGGE